MISWPSFFLGIAAMVTLSLGVIGVFAALARGTPTGRHNVVEFRLRDGDWRNAGGTVLRAHPTRQSPSLHS
jgi:hypothetical protein